MSQSSALKYLEDNKTRFTDELIELLRIPSISKDPNRGNEMKQAAGWLVNKLRSMGVNNVEAMPTAGYPAVYGEWMNGSDDAATVLIYGHYDVQYAEPLEDWKSQPFEPEISNDNLYARGASDMKGQTLAAVNAVEAIMKTENLPINIKFLIEGEEEIGSKNLFEFLVQNSEKLKCDFSLNTDAGGMPDAYTPSICYSLRGGASFNLEIFGPSQDLHSGEFGGTIDNPIHVMSRFIASLHDANGHVTLPGFYDKVRELDAEERAVLAKLPFDEIFLLKHSGAPALWGEPDFTPAERIGARPTIETVLFRAGQQKSAIPAKATAGFVFRLVPDQVPDDANKQFRKYIEGFMPPTVTWNLQLVISSPPFITERKSPYIDAMQNALQTVFGKEPIMQRGGGGIGAVLMMKKSLGIDSVLTGFSLFDDNIHGPNEKLHLPTWEKGMKALVHFFHNLVEM